MPKFSTATGWKMCVLSKPAYLAALRVAAASAAEPAFMTESPIIIINVNIILLLFSTPGSIDPRS